MELPELIARIGPPDESARAAARSRWNACAKPLGSLGLLEAAIEEIAALTGSADVSLARKAVLVFCADNGVVAQGVTQTGSGVTAAVARQLALGRTSVCRMAAVAECRVVPVDLGIRDFSGCEGVLDRRVGNGTADLTEAPAMTRAQAERAILTGAELVREEAARGVRLLAAGEMGIGNTTTAAAVVCALLGLPGKRSQAAARGFPTRRWRARSRRSGAGSSGTAPTRETRWTCWQSSAALTSRGCAARFSEARCTVCRC